MRFNEGADLDTSDVTDIRGSGGRGGFGGRGIAVGGGGLGLVGLIVVVLINVLGGGGGSSTGAGAVPGFGGISQGGTADNSQLEQDCRSGADANRDVQCAAVAEINSIQDFWEQTLGGRYQRTDTVFFTDQVNTQCGSATSGSGPFYCPADKLVYIDITFFDDLKSQFGAEGGTFVDAYVLAHEVGHHVQNILGTSERVHRAPQSEQQGADGLSVRLELQADCFAGLWANSVFGPGSDVEITEDDVRDALTAAEAIGDDRLQEQAGVDVNPETWSHGSSDQRVEWFNRGFEGGQLALCDTFNTEL